MKKEKLLKETLDSIDETLVELHKQIYFVEAQRKAIVEKLVKVGSKVQVNQNKTFFRGAIGTVVGKYPERSVAPYDVRLDNYDVRLDNHEFYFPTIHLSADQFHLIEDEDNV